MTIPEIRTIRMEYGWLAAIGCGANSKRAIGKTRDEAVAALLDIIRPTLPKLEEERVRRDGAAELEY